MAKPKIQQVVNVIESPSPNDVLEDRREGYALVEALRLAEIPHRYFAVSDLETLKKSIDIIAYAPHVDRGMVGEQLVTDTINIPSLHISAHGNKHGIALTDGTLIPWGKLGEVINEINKGLGYGGSEDEPRSMLTLAMSCCKGLYARAMFEGAKPCPVFAILGSEEDIPWSDSLTGWITYYHLFITKNFTAHDALERMNLAVGNNHQLFRLYYDHGICI